MVNNHFPSPYCLSHHWKENQQTVYVTVVCSIVEFSGHFVNNQTSWADSVNLGIWD